MATMTERAQTPETTRFPKGIAFVDGAYCRLDEAKLSIFDWGFLRSDVRPYVRCD